MRNRQAIPIADIPVWDQKTFDRKAGTRLNSGKRLSAFFALPEAKDVRTFVAIFADDSRSELQPMAFQTDNNTFHSLTAKFQQFHLFEREIYAETGILPVGHPWVKPVRFPRDSKFPGNPSIGDIDFFRIDSEETHQVAVGPVHAGIIEPGHFRFQCHGETVHHLEISLGYQHRGIAKQLVGGPDKSTIHLLEVASGDATIAHTSAYCGIIETLAKIVPTDNSRKLRAIALELERCANHIGDLGAMAGDIGYLPTMSYCGRIRGDFLNMTGLLCGNRFGRGFVVPGGVRYACDADNAMELRKRLAKGKDDFLSAVSLLWDTTSVLARFEDTGVLSAEFAKSVGMVGVAARASGVKMDSRRSHPFGAYENMKIDIPTCDSGDVMARARIRWEEVLTSIAIIEDLISESLDDTSPRSNTNTNDLNLAPESIAVSMVEGWRGEVCHVAITDDKGKFAKYKIIDPSFHNWIGLAMALRSERIADFPICNKSFSLSYCGFDL